MTDNSRISSSMSLIQKIKVDGTPFEAIATQGGSLPVGGMSVSLHPAIDPNEVGAEAVPSAQPSLAAPSQPSTQPPRVCVICNKATKRSVHISHSRVGPEDDNGDIVTERRSFRFYVCELHASIPIAMSMEDLEDMAQSQAQIGTGFVKRALEQAPAVPYDGGKVDTATAQVIEQALQAEATSYAKLPDPNRVYVELLQNKVDSFRNAVKDAMAKDAETISATAPDEAAAEELN
jgi:hypothetical protein